MKVSDVLSQRNPGGDVVPAHAAQEVDVLVRVPGADDVARNS